MPNITGADLLAALSELVSEQSQPARFKTNSTAQYMHGPGGLFNDPALEAAVFSTLMLPVTGVAANIPAFQTTFTNPSYGILTGQTDTTGAEMEDDCGTPPLIGKLKLCTQNLPLGKFSRRTQLYNLMKMGRLENRGEHTDFRTVGNAFYGSGGGNPMLGQFGGNLSNVNSDPVAAMTSLAIAFARDFAPKTYTGTPTNNTNGYQEFYGLESLVNTGYRDAITGTACAAADSTLIDFGSQNINTGGATVAAAIVNEMEKMHANLLARSQWAGLAPVKWVVAVTWRQFYELTSIWPVTYSTTRAAAVVPTNATMFVDSREVRNERDAMFANGAATGQYLWLNGQRIDVWIDDSIPETEVSPGTFESDYYFLPISALGQYTLFWEYFNQTVTVARANELAKTNGAIYQTSDNGRFFWISQPVQGTCVDVYAYVEPRLVLRTPFLAGRIQNVRVSPLRNPVSPFPTDPYYVNGGKTSGSSPSYYSPTA